MKKNKIKCAIVKLAIMVLVFLSGTAYAQLPLIQNTYNRECTTLNGKWHYIVDVYEYGYYNYRWQPRDESSNPGNDAYFLNTKAKNKTDLIEYDFDKSPTMIIPRDWNTQEEKLFYYEGTVWFKKSFSLERYSSESRYFVRFEAVNYRSDVYLNGKKLGMHKGGFTPFNYEITDIVKEKDNFIIVKADNKRAADEVPTLNTDWWNYGGITRDVGIYKLPKTFIEDYKLQLAKGNYNLITGYVQLNGHARANVKVNVSIPEMGIKKQFRTDPNGYLTIELAASRLKLWSTETPYLYKIEISSDEDLVTDKIGFRQIEAQGMEILLNGKPQFLRGICIHEENTLRGGRAYSLEDSKMLLGWAKDLGCNYVRLAHYPHNENMARLADEMGILVWEENPVYWTIQWDNPSTFRKASDQLKELISRDKNRASVIIWSMANETPVFEARTVFIHNLIDTARKYDNTRLISAALEDHSSKNNGYIMEIDDPIAEFVDILSFNQYNGWYSGTPDQICKYSWEIKQNKPVLISEFGGGALHGYHADSLTRWSEEYQEYLYKETLPMLETIPQFRGLTPWILADFRSPRRMLPNIQDGWNRKGLISETGNKKKAYFVLQNYYQKKISAGKLTK